MLQGSCLPACVLPWPSQPASPFAAPPCTHTHTRPRKRGMQRHAYSCQPSCRHHAHSGGHPTPLPRCPRHGCSCVSMQQPARPSSPATHTPRLHPPPTAAPGPALPVARGRHAAVVLLAHPPPRRPPAGGADGLAGHAPQAAPRRRERGRRGRCGGCHQQRHCGGGLGRHAPAVLQPAPHGGAGCVGAWHCAAWRGLARMWCRSGVAGAAVCCVCGVG